MSRYLHSRKVCKSTIFYYGLIFLLVYWAVFNGYVGIGFFKEPTISSGIGKGYDLILFPSLLPTEHGQITSEAAKRGILELYILSLFVGRQVKRT
ncbi:hypothetical protein KDW_38510 [Dictyobacter vulcani]|uniref:Uncharacterized protein n=1 Tax=Dictyobacter vulcani TaxID=2607529 RepID=A0A5J4KUE8_9CHLR|nr:hypothetical protein KDW_38510 [Dictyobacter vulcani]